MVEKTTKSEENKVQKSPQKTHSNEDRATRRSGGHRPNPQGTHSYEDDKEIGLAIIAHLSGLVALMIGPIVIYAATDNMFARENAANAFNWQLTLTIYMFISAVLLLIVIGIFGFIILSFLNLLFCVLGAIKAANGKSWEYPITMEVLEAD